MSSPIVAKNVIVKFGTTAVTFADSVRITVEYETIRQPILSQEAPLVIKTIKRVRFTLRKCYVDDTLLQRLSASNPEDVTIMPEGEGSGKKLWTIDDAVFYSLDRPLEAGEIIKETIEGEGKEFTEGTQS